MTAALKKFVIIRVPVTLDENRNPLRRPNFGQSPIIVADAASRGEAAAKVAELSFGDYRHHYYALEMVAMGAPDRKSAIHIEQPKPPKGGKPKLVAVSKERKAS